MTRVILSYRKFNAGDTARRLQPMLVSTFGAANIITGTESLVNFDPDTEHAVIDTVMQADALLVIIDRDWLAGGWVNDYTDSDVVAINTALFEPSTEVIPLLLDGAPMPSTAELPVNLDELARQKPVRISSATLYTDIRQVIQRIDPNAAMPVSNNQQFPVPPKQPYYNYQQQIPVATYQRSSSADPNLVFVVELIAAWFGFLGIGHMLSGNTGRGIASMVGWWIFGTVGFIIAAITVVGLCIFIPAALVIPFWSAFEARNYALTH